MLRGVGHAPSPGEKPLHSAVVIRCPLLTAPRTADPRGSFRRQAVFQGITWGKDRNSWRTDRR